MCAIAAADLVAQGRCLYCVPSSCIAALPGTVWKRLGWLTAAIQAASPRQITPDVAGRGGDRSE
jgi:hypothetical protein